jgi:hypothetical protein
MPEISSLKKGAGLFRSELLKIKRKAAPADFPWYPYDTLGNFNMLRGARLLKETLGSKVEIHEVDLDSQFRLPRSDYGLVFFLGILYHLKNPFYALESLSGRSAGNQQ